MNKQEKIICMVLGIALMWCFFAGRSSGPAEPEKAQIGPVVTNEVSAVASEEPKPAVEEKAQAKPVQAAPSVPEEIVVLENDELRLELTTWGAAVKSAVLKKIPSAAGEVSESNRPVVLDYSLSPLGRLSGVSDSSVYAIKAKEESAVVFTNASGGIERRITLKSGYGVVFEDAFADAAKVKENAMSLGVMEMGSGENDILSVDSLDANGKVVHYGDSDETTLYALLAGGTSAGGCGCGGARSAKGEGEWRSGRIGSFQKWIALKNRFFVTALVSCDQANAGFSVDVSREMALDTYRPKVLAANAVFAGGVERRTTEFFVGPKNQALLWDAGMKDVMEFGMWRWVCYPMVWALNFFHSVIPNYGVAIILLTILVRLIFWPLTRKSTEGMKKMQEIQPLLKELQAKFKDNPQRLQQETWALYREKKVNPMSSCLPMLVQIPIFIALFNVLRSMVELRYAGFLWISDLSEPERLFASWFPFGGLNILPLLMAGTMFLQSKLTPSAGDKNQQRMMTVFMPLMMLFMFYGFASALSLYWTVSQALSILQMWMMRRETQKKQKALEPEVIDPPQTTRQMRRHG